MKVMYFAWLRQKTGRSDETIELPDGVRTVGDLLTERGGHYPRLGEVAASGGVVRCAVNQRHVDRDHPIGPNDEIAFFPPVTGG
jgi:molybdopterin synthase sulfur carrier subunit